MNLRARQKEKAIAQAEELGKMATDEDIQAAIEKSSRFKDNPLISKIWDKVLILIHIIRSPLFAKGITAAAAGALIYLVSPIDVIPDVIMGVGLLDDVFVLSTITAGVVKHIKSDPVKALQFIDSLPERLKVPASTLFGIAGGAAAGATLGKKGGEWLKHNSLEEVYQKINPEGGTLDEVIQNRKKEAEGIITNLLSTQLKKVIQTSFQKRILRGLAILVLFLLAVLITLEPIIGNASRYIASILLTAAYAITIYSIASTIRKLIPYIKASLKEKSILKGIEAVLEKEYSLFRSGKKVLIYAAEQLHFNLELSKEEIKTIAAYIIKLFWREALLFAAGTAVLILSFFLLRHGLVRQALSLSPLELLFFPFFA